jgi:hypothetical protein
MRIVDKNKCMVSINKGQLVKYKQCPYPIEGIRANIVKDFNENLSLDLAMLSNKEMIKQRLFINHRWHSPKTITTNFLLDFGVFYKMGFDRIAINDDKHAEFSKNIEKIIDGKKYKVCITLYIEYSVHANFNGNNKYSYFCDYVGIDSIKVTRPAEFGNVSREIVEWNKNFTDLKFNLTYLQLLGAIKDGATVINSPIFGDCKQAIKHKSLGYFQYLMLY